MVFTDPGRGLGRRDPQVPRDLRRGSGALLLSRTSTTIRPTGRRTSRPRRPEIIEQTERPHDAFRRRPGHQRHVHGRDAAAAARHARSAVHLGAASSRLPWPRGLEAHADGDRAGHLRSSRWPTRISGSRPKTPTRWCGGWRAKKGCWSASPRAANVAAAMKVARQIASAASARDRHHPLRRRGQIPQRAFLG